MGSLPQESGLRGPDAAEGQEPQEEGRPVPRPALPTSLLHGGFFMPMVLESFLGSPFWGVLSGEPFWGILKLDSLFVG